MLLKDRYVVRIIDLPAATAAEDDVAEIMIEQGIPIIRIIIARQQPKDSDGGASKNTWPCVGYGFVEVTSGNDLERTVDALTAAGFVAHAVTGFSSWPE